MTQTIKYKNEKERKIAGYIIGAVILLVIGALVYNFVIKKDPAKVLDQVNTEVFSVSVEKPKMRDLKHQLLTSGSLKALEEAVIYPRVSGKLLRNVLREGDKLPLLQGLLNCPKLRADALNHAFLVFQRKQKKLPY